MAIRPFYNDIEHLVWIAKALSNLNSYPKHPCCILIQYFWPISHNMNVQKFYIGWDCRNGLQWKVHPTNKKVWESTNSILTTWKSGTRKDTFH